MIVQNKNNKGNPYHDEEGKFATKNETMSKKNLYSKLFGENFFEDENDNELNSLFKKIDEESNNRLLNNKLNAKYNPKDRDKIENLTDYDYVEGLGSLKDELDIDEISKLSLDEQKKILELYNFLNDKHNDEDYKKLEKLNQKQFYNLWPSPVSAKDYLEKKDKIESLKTYYSLFFLGGQELKNQKLNDIKEFEKIGKEYLELSEKINEKYNLASDIIEKYENKNSDYSRTRKNNAVWVKSGLSESIDEFSEVADRVFEKFDDEKIDSVVNYTGDNYFLINTILRGQKYYYDDDFDNEYSEFSFEKEVNNITEIIDNSSYDKDIWLERGTSEIIDEANGINIEYDMPSEKLQELVGKTFKDQAFVSCSASKGSSFTWKSIIINTYCPKGTKMLYLPGKSGLIEENEMLLQRGYSYKIKKVEKKNGKLYLDVDVLLGTDKEKHDENKIKELKETKFIKE